MDNGANWTDERVDRLKKLWSEGLSASQIAAQLGGVSRNAVIGKVHRLNLPGRAKAGGATSARSQKRVTIPAQASRPAAFAPRTVTRTITRPVGATMLKEDVEVEVQEVIRVASDNVVVPIFKRLPLIRLTERTCKWPLGDPLKEDFCFCGNDSPDNTPYCTYHQKLAYQPSAERRRVR